MTRVTGAKRPDGQLIVVGRDCAELIEGRSCRAARINVELGDNCNGMDKFWLMDDGGVVEQQHYT